MGLLQSWQDSMWYSAATSHSIALEWAKEGEVMPPSLLGL